MTADDHPSTSPTEPKGGGNRKLRKRILELQTEIIQRDAEYREAYKSVCKQVYDLYLAGLNLTDETFEPPSVNNDAAETVRAYVSGLEARIKELEAK